MNPFQKASRSQVFLKLGMTGVTGSGKTFSAIRLMAGLIDPGKRIAFTDTENESASLYSDLDADQCRKMKIPTEHVAEVMASSRLFDCAPIAPPYPAETFRDHVAMAVENDYGGIIIDSASHFWKGILAYKDSIDSHGRGNIYTNWKQADGKFDPVMEAVLQSKIHVIFCMRSKMDYAQTEENGKTTVKKLGLAPIMRDGLEFEFTTVFDIGSDHTAVASKDRSGMFPTDRIFTITEATGREFRDWLNTATPKADPEEAAKAKAVLSHREIIESKRGITSAEAFEVNYCWVMSSMLEDKTPRTRLEQFTYTELRGVWKQSDKIIAAVMELRTAA